MFMTRAMAEALLEAIKNPRDGVYKLRNGHAFLRDKNDGEYRAVVFKDRVLSTVEEQ